MAEQLICNQQVDGSTPFASSNSCNTFLGDFPSGQRGQTVNLLSTTSLVRIQHPPPQKHFERSAFLFVVGDAAHLTCLFALAKIWFVLLLTNRSLLASEDESKSLASSENPARFISPQKHFERSAFLFVVGGCCSFDLPFCFSKNLVRSFANESESACKRR